MKHKFVFIITLSILATLVTPTVLADSTFRNSNSDLTEHYNEATGDVEGIATIYSYERLKTSDNSFTNFRFFNNSNDLTFESATTSAKFYKDGSVRLFPSGLINSGEPPLISSISHTIKEAVNGTDEWHILDSVNSLGILQEHNESLDGMKIRNSKGNWITDYDVKFTGSLKWTFSYTNDDPLKTNHKYGFTTVFMGDFIVKVDGNTYFTTDMPETVFISAADLGDQLLIIQDYNGFKVAFDPQNSIHNYLWAIKIQPHKIILDFTYAKGVLPVGETLTIDPVFGFTSGTQYRVDGKSISGAACHGATNNKAVSTVTYSLPTTGLSGCSLGAVQFDISAVPSYVNTISNVTIRHTSSTLTNPRNCDYVAMGTVVPSTDTHQQIWDQIGNGTKYANNNAACTTTGEKSVALSTAAGTDIKNRLGNLTTNFSVGFKPNSMTRDALVHQLLFSTNPSLQFVYVYTPDNPTNLSCTSVGLQVQCSWTASTHTSNYYLGRSLDNSTFTNKTSVGNTTSTTLTSFFAVNRLYYMNVTALGLERNSTGSSFTSFTTDNYPGIPQNTVASPTSTNSTIVRWAPPTSNGNDPITGYRIQYCLTCTSWTQLVNNTNTLNYNQTGLSSGQTVKYRMATWNNVGSSDWSANFTAKTYLTTNATITLTSIDTIGDTIKLNVTTLITAASPSPVTVQQFKLYKNNTLSQTYPESISIVEGSSNTTTIWYRMTDPNQSYGLHLKAVITNNTGTVTKSSNNVTAHQEYDPEYVDAIDITQGQVATVGTNAQLKVNRIGVAGNYTWQIECFFKDWSTVFLNGTDGTWINQTAIGAFKVNSPTPTLDTYATCWNDGLLFEDQLVIGNFTNYIIPGLVIFDQLGGFLGAPSVLIFILAIFSWGTGRNFPIVIVIGVSALGLMGALGLLILEQSIWSIIFALAGLAIFGIRKFF